MFITAGKLRILNWGTVGTGSLWSQPQVAIQGSAVFSSSVFASFCLSPEEKLRGLLLPI